MKKTCDVICYLVLSLNFHFCCFRAMAYIRRWNWVQLWDHLYISWLAEVRTSNLARSYIKNMQNLVKRVMRSYMMHFRNFGIPLQSQVKWVTWPTFGILSPLYLENENAKLGQMGLWEGQVTHFCNFGTFLISDKQLKLETSNMARRLIARRYIENMLEECWKKL